jgi:alcohol dehydrogenase
MKSKLFKALVVREKDDRVFVREFERKEIMDLPDNDVLIRVRYSGLNYKDALSATGNKGVTKHYPHTPGIDASGVVEESRNELIKPGDEVLVTGYDLGMNTDGGLGEYIRVPGEWVVPKPQDLTLKECMIYGTAGFTASLGIHKMLQMGQDPGDGEVVVTGASGGVGSLAVAILNRIGFDVIASTGKTDAHVYLENIGASRIIGREAVDDQSGKPLLKCQWAGAFDTVGGNVLATLLKACARHGNIASCGNVLSYKLETTVFPFILNGVNLLGVDSATCPMPLRKELWQKLSGEWKTDKLDQIAKFVKPDELNPYIDKILQGKIIGRIIVEMD